MKRGLKKNYIILAVDGKSVTNLDNLKVLIRKGLSENQEVLLKIEKDNGVIGYYELKN
jgi:S1-C subfamily serine protease